MTILSGVAFVAEGLLYLADEQALQDVLLAFAYVLIAAGLLGFHALQRTHYALIGRLGLAAVIAGWAIALVGHVGNIDAAHGIGFLLALVGYLLYGTASARAGALARWWGVLIAVAGPLSLLAGEYSTIAFGVLWIALGVALRSGAVRRRSPTAIPAAGLQSGVLVLALATLGLAGFAGCAGSETDRRAVDPDKVTLRATEPANGRYAIEGPRSINSGAVEITLDNQTSKPREAQLIRIEGGHTVNEALAQIKGAMDGRAVPDWLRWAGGTGETMPGKSATFTVELRPGRYYAVDTTSGEGEDAKLLAALGAVSPLQIVAADSPADLPSTPASITATEYAFDTENLTAGRSLVEFHNAGSEPHHFVLAPILEGRTFADVKRFATTDQADAPPVDFENQIISGVMDGGTRQVARLELQAGRYALLCFVSDRAGGPPHVEKGMLAEVTVKPAAKRTATSTGIVGE